VREVISRVRGWWADPPRPPASAEPYDVPCLCGQHTRGVRTARHQVVRCLACGAPVFVLGFSPLAPAQPAAPARSRYWRGPVLAAALTLAAVVLAFSFLIRALAPLPARPRDNGPEEVRGLIAAGREALRDEKFRVAVARFAEARSRRDEHPESLSAAEGRELNRLYRQAALLADLLSESLGQILASAAGTREEEWRAHFAERYRDRAVIFDDVVTRDAAGRYELATYEVRAPGEPARVALNDLKLLAALRLAEPRRLLFGARLARLSREEGGGHGLWVIHLDPDSGVLITDEEVAGACCPQPLDADLRAVLERQAEWAAGLP
jgi:hypothetical protein